MVATNSMATRSSLELMLDKLQQMEDRPKESPPALPVRPVSRARLPRPRKPLQLDFESKRIKKDDFSESFCQEDSDGFDRFEKKKEIFEDSKEITEKGICKIQKCYRAHQVRCYYKELKIGTIALQSFIRGENARRSYQYMSRTIVNAIILIQKQTRKYFQRRVLKEHQSGIQHSDEIIYEPKSDHAHVQYNILVELQKRVLRSEAKVREKNEQNLALKKRLEEMEKKWQQYEERMKSLEKEWQDQLTYIQESLAAAKKNHNDNGDKFTIIAGTPNGRTLDIQINSGYHQELVKGEDGNFTEVGYEQSCIRFHPQAELRKLQRRFKAWKKEYKNKLRDAQSTFKKIGNSETVKNQKNWWGRSSN